MGGGNYAAHASYDSGQASEALDSRLDVGGVGLVDDEGAHFTAALNQAEHRLLLSVAARIRMLHRAFLLADEYFVRFDNRAFAAH
ncbi:hypothetical protein T281_09585 [Rhodomicrobium udaipurense JA643]|nr:hypothetical protein T281_09585 [Rhodomicrobium udaipurense JA643]